MMLQAVELIADLAAALCIAGCAFMLASIYVVLTWQPGAPSRTGASRPVSILKPLHGAEPRLFGRLASFCRQEYAGALQLVLGALDDKDPALEVADRLKLAFPESELAVVAGGREHGANRKVSNLINMQAHAQHDVILFSDSDIQAPSHHLQSIVDTLESPGVGAVTCLYHGVAGAGLCSHLSAMAINTHFLPEVILAMRFRLARPCFGAAICLKSETLERAGGLRSLAGVLADDFVLGEAVRKLGKRVELAPGSVGHVCFEDRLKDLIDRQLRVAVTVKSIDQLGYLGSAITHPLAWALVAAAFGQSLLLFIIALILRLGVMLSIEHKFSLPRQRRWLLPLHDVLAFGVFLLSLNSAKVVWRGAPMRVQSCDGRITRDEGAS